MRTLFKTSYKCGVRRARAGIGASAQRSRGGRVLSCLTGLVFALFVSPASVAVEGIDSTPPAVVIGSPSVNDASNGPVEYEVSFSGEAGEILSGELRTQIVSLITTGSVSGRVLVEDVDTFQWRVRLVDLIGDGTVGIRIAAGSVVDEAGNASDEVSSALVNVDNSPISVSIGAASRTPVQSGPVSFLVRYLGVSTISLGADDVLLETTGDVAAAVSVTGEGLIERTIILDDFAGNGTISVSLPEGTGEDAGGNPAPSAVALSPVVVDSEAPVVGVGAPAALVSSGGSVTFPVVVTGDGDVSLYASDVLVFREGTADGDVVVSGEGAAWEVRLDDVRGDGALSIAIRAGVAMDGAGNLSEESAPSEIVTVDTTVPVVTVNQHSSQADPARQFPITFGVVFSEPVSGFGVEDIATDGSATGVAVSVQGSGESFRVFVTGASAPGTIELRVVEGAVADLAGNPNGPSVGEDTVVEYLPQLPQCDLTSISMLFPRDGARVIVGPGRYPVNLHFAAETDCELSTLMVEYSIGGLQIGSAIAAPYVVSVDDITSVLEPGEYTLYARALHRDSGRPVVESVSRFEIVQALSVEDPERDGVPNDPGVSLPTADDVWIATARQAPLSGLRTVLLERTPELSEPGESRFLAVSDPESPDSRVSATVGLGPLSGTPGGLLMMAMAGDPVALFDETVMDVLGFEPSQGLVPGGRYVYLNYLAAGESPPFSPGVQPPPFAAEPIRIRFEGLPVEAGGLESWYTHPVTIGPDEKGVRIGPVSGEWGQSNLGEVGVEDGAITAELMSFALAGPFKSPFVPNAILTVRPTTVNFGQVTMFSAAEAEFVIANDGGTLLEGRVTIPEPFEVVSGGTYAVKPGDSHLVRVRFSPPGTDEYVVVGQASGPQNRSVTLRGSGQFGAGGGSGCAASSGFGGLPGKRVPFDFVAALAVTGVLAFRRRAARTA